MGIGIGIFVILEASIQWGKEQDRTPGNERERDRVREREIERSLRGVFGPVLGAFMIENERFRGPIRWFLGGVLGAFTIKTRGVGVRFGGFWETFWAHSRLKRSVSGPS